MHALSQIAGYNHILQDRLRYKLTGRPMLTVDKKNTLFLLGGHDLEMLTIRDILFQNDYPHLDGHLRWDNALLSHYQKDIEPFLSQKPLGKIYGIELENDLCLTTARYQPIDHHNGLADCPCALEQILSLLQIPINRHYRLVAANDKSYIPGMQAIGATDDEIKAIRQADRQAQGVTEEDEQLAQKAITENLKRTGDLTIIKAYSPRFSPICDQLYPYKSLLVYTVDEWMYYGNRSKQIQKTFAGECRKGKLFYGGDTNGYIGSKKGAYTETEIHEIIKKIEYELI